VDEDLPSLKTAFEYHIYNEIRENFKSWVCLWELDLTATVSFRGFDIIRKNEFSDESSIKYKRGILCSRLVLSHLSRKLKIMQEHSYLAEWIMHQLI
jgi:hypothetical protein